MIASALLGEPPLAETGPAGSAGAFWKGAA
jgi:hypothetical protein